MNQENRPVWLGAALRLGWVAVAGLGLIVVHREVVLPILQGDVERAQHEHAGTGGAGVLPPAPPAGR